MNNDGRPTPLKNDLIDNLRRAIEEGKHDETVLEAERLAALIGQE